MPSLSYQLLISVLVVNAIVYFLLAAKAKNKGTANTYNVAIFFLVSIPTVIVYTVTYLGLMFFQFNSKITNTYSEGPITVDTRVVIKPSKLFADKGAPDYIGKEMKDMNLKIGDTIRTIASYQQGDFVSGQDFSKIIYNGKPCWYSDDNVSQTLFAYTYLNQPLSFKADADENKIYWERAKIYIKAYEQANHQQDSDVAIFNDTLMKVGWQSVAGGGRHLYIKKTY